MDQAVVDKVVDHIKMRVAKNSLSYILYPRVAACYINEDTLDPPNLINEITQEIAEFIINMEFDGFYLNDFIINKLGVIFFGVFSAEATGRDKLTT